VRQREVRKPSPYSAMTRLYSAASTALTAAAGKSSIKALMPSCAA
jgi:hypothetical protein